MNGIREIDIERIPQNALDLIKSMREEKEPNKYVSLLNQLESYFTQAQGLIEEISELNYAKASGEDTYPHEFEISDKMHHFGEILEDIIYTFHQLSDRHPPELDILVSAAKNFVSYLNNLPFEKKERGVRVVDISTKKSQPMATGYHQ